MLSYASDFWPLFWLIIGAGAVLTVLACLLVAVFSPAWFRHDRHESAGRLPSRAASGHVRTRGYSRAA